MSRYDTYHILGNIIRELERLNADCIRPHEDKKRKKKPLLCYEDAIEEMEKRTVDLLKILCGLGNKQPNRKFKKSNGKYTQEPFETDEDEETG